MSKAKEYNKGVESGLKVAQEIIEKEIEAMDYLKSKVDLIVEGHDQMNSAVNKLIDDADEKAIQDIYGICNSIMPNEIKDHEQKILLDIIASLCTAKTNDNQKKYYNNLRHHLNIQGYEPNSNYNFKNIEALESVKSIKVIAKAVRIFLFLFENNMDGVYLHEDDLFSHFELRSFDEIDATIELIFCLFEENGLIEFYGNFMNTDKDDENGKKLPYLHVEEKEMLDISFNCAQVYFKDKERYDKNLAYIESSTYILYSENNNISCIHKVTGQKAIVIDNLESGYNMIKNKKITTYADMVYYVIDNFLYYINLDNFESGQILKIDEQYDEEGQKYDISNICIYKSEKLIYRNGSCYIIDLEKGMSSVKEIGISVIKFGFGEHKSDNYFLIDDYIYYLTQEFVLSYKYKIKKYCINSDVTTDVTEKFGEDDITATLSKSYDNVFGEGVYNNHYYLIFEYSGLYSSERSGFDCFCFDLNKCESGNVPEERFYIWQSHIYQIEQYKDNLIYVNADKNYKLIKHNFISDKKSTIINKYGHDIKSTFSDRLIFGKGEYQRPNKYMRLGKWIWIQGKTIFDDPKIISI